MPGRTLAIGDIHGCSQALGRLVEIVAPTQSDTVVLLGDLVDKAPDTRGVLDRVLDLQSRVERLVIIRGNHDEHLLFAVERWKQGVRDWQGIEQFETFRSYGGVEHIPAAHIELLESSVGHWETPTHVFVHASLQPGVPLAQQDAEWLRYRYLTPDVRPWPTGQRVICGHLPQATGVPWVLPGWVDLDTAAFRGGWLTCLDVEDNTLWRANEAGASGVSDLPSLARRT